MKPTPRTDEAPPVNLKTSAEQRAYSKGYAAGRRHVEAKAKAANYQRERREFIRSAMIHFVPVAMQVTGWSWGDKPIKTADERIMLAKQWAEQSWRMVNNL